jgi:hypothetical protein
VRRQDPESTVTIRRPVDDVSAFTIDMFNPSRVRGMTLASRVVSPGPPGVGSVVEQRVVSLGFESHLRFTVIGWDPPHAVVPSVSWPLPTVRRRRPLRHTAGAHGPPENTKRLIEATPPNTAAFERAASVLGPEGDADVPANGI